MSPEEFQNHLRAKGHDAEISFNMEKRIVKMAVAALNSNGEPDLFFCWVTCTEQQRDSGEHYDAAKTAASAEGYKPALAYDEDDPPGAGLMELAVWESMSTIDIREQAASPLSLYEALLVRAAETLLGRSDLPGAMDLATRLLAHKEGDKDAELARDLREFITAHSPQ